MIESSFIEYLMYFSPVIFGHVIFPPLSYFVGDKNEFLQSVVYPNLPPEFFERRLIQSMLLDQNRKDVVETYVTHMFVHVTYQHLFSNLFSAIQLGYPVYCEFGVFGLYAVFFGGGVFASVPSPLHLGQKKQVKKDYENIFSSFGKQYLPPFLGGAWDGVSGYLGGATSWLFTPSKSCGSSGAVYAMMGCSLGTLIRDLFVGDANLFDLRRGNMVLFRRDGKVRKRYWSEWLVVVSENIQRIIYNFVTDPHSIWKVIRFIYLVEFLLVELGFVFDLDAFFRPALVTVGLGHLDTSLLWRPTGRAKSFQEARDGGMIGHASHVQGMLFGLAYSGAFGVVLPYFAKKFR